MFNTIGEKLKLLFIMPALPLIIVYAIYFVNNNISDEEVKEKCLKYAEHIIGISALGWIFLIMLAI